MLDKIKEYYNNNKILVFMYLTFILLFVCSLIFIYNKFKDEPTENNNIQVATVNEVEVEEERKNNEMLLKVDIKGNVVNPGVYELKEGSRVIDLVNLAGGLNTGANTDYVNLSKTLENEMVIYIYSNDEIKEFNNSKNKTSVNECICEEKKNDACVNIEKDNGNYIVNEEVSSTNNESSDKISLININSATLEQLKTLTGIGESKAKAIIEYRNQNGKFSDISEITKVSGISEAIFAKIKENITV